MHARLMLALLVLVLGGCGPTEEASETISPTARIAHERIDECSGIVYLEGAFYVHNDSGDDPVIYRGTRLDFADAEVLTVDGAAARDWEDITVLEGDLLVGDIGDNRREREELTLYRVRYLPADKRLQTVATYRVRYPDEPHDAEALACIEDVLHLITKARGDSVTNVYAFDDLGEGTVNVPRLVGQLDIGVGEQITAGTYDPHSRTLVLLTYTHILCYPVDQIRGLPASRTLIGARQCEAVCFRGDDLIFTNEQRDVFVVDDYIARAPEKLLPARGMAHLPACANDWESHAAELPLYNTQAGESIVWACTAQNLHIKGRLRCRAKFQPTLLAGEASSEKRKGPRLGSVILFNYADAPGVALTGAERQFAVGQTLQGDFAIWQIDLTGERLELTLFDAGALSADVRGGEFAFELRLPRGAVLGSPLPAQFLFDLHGLRLRGEDEVRFSGVDVNTIYRPYLWGDVTILP